MPGGVPTVTNTLPDLQSFLSRKRISLKLWLESKNITTVEAFLLFKESNSLWTISQNLVDQVQELLKPVVKEIATEKVVIVEQPLVSEETEIVSETQLLKERKKTKQS